MITMSQREFQEMIRNHALQIERERQTADTWRSMFIETNTRYVAAASKLARISEIVGDVV